MVEMKNIRSLNEDGIREFASINCADKAGADGDAPSHLLFDNEFSEVKIFSDGKPREIDVNAVIITGFDLVELLDKSFDSTIGIKELEKDPGMWAWIALLYYDQFRGRLADGSWKRAAAPRWIPSGESTSYYRHTVAARYNMHRRHGGNADYILHGLVDNWADVYEQYTNVSLMITSESIQEVANRIAFDPSREKGFKKGIGGKGPGSARRFPAVFWQLHNTYNLRSMTSDEILELLPEEFDKYNPLKGEGGE